MSPQIFHLANYHFSLYSVPPFMTALATLFLGIVVLTRERSSRISLSFFWITLVVFTWLAAFSLMYCSVTKEMALQWAKLAYIGVPFIPSAIYGFTAKVLRIDQPRKKFIRFNWILSLVFSSLVITSSSLVKDLYLYWWGYYPQYGWVSIPYLIFFLGLMCFTFFEYFMAYRKTTSRIHKRRILFFSIGFSIAYLGSFDYLAKYGIALYPFGYFPVFIFLVIAAQTIVRYRLVDITPSFAANEILATMADPVIVCDREGQIRFINPAASEVFEFSEEELIYQCVDLLTLRSEDLETLLDKVLPQTLRGCEMMFRTKTGQRIDVSISSSALYDHEHQQIGSVIIARDIREHKRLETELGKSFSQLQDILDNTTAVIYVKDTLGRYRLINHQFEILFNIPKKEIFGKTDHDIFPKKMADILRENDKKVLQNQSPLEMEEEAHYNNQTRTYLSLKFPLKDVQGTSYAICGISTDITERKQAEKILRQTHDELEKQIQERTKELEETNHELQIEIQQRKQTEKTLSYLASIVESSEDAIIGKTLDGIITSWNKGAEKLYGYTIDEIKNKSISILFPVNRKCELLPILERLRQGECVNLFETERVRKDGKYIDVSVAISPIKDLNGQIIGASTIARDITERKKLDRMKSEFISTISHELKTPLTSIRGSLDIIALEGKAQIPEKAKALLEIATRNCERLSKLISDILDTQKIESGKIDFNIEEVDLLPLIKQAMDINQFYANQFKVKFLFEAETKNPKVKADGDRLIQVLTNLLCNATKFSPPHDNVVISVRENDKKVRVSITDHGPGISEDFKKDIFQKFSRSDFSKTHQKGGTGLGLWISKSILEQMGGEVNFESSSNGTTFYCELPVWDEETALAHPVSPLKVNSSKILVCEDDPDVATLLSMMLHENGFEADVVSNAHHAKEKLLQNHYDAMTLDILLPDQDGISLVKELRLNKKTQGLPIVIVSAKAQQAHEELTQSNIQKLEWVDKPVNPQKLIHLVRNLTS